MTEELFDIFLKDEEMMAIFVLGQMQNKMVRIHDPSRDWKQVGFFRIEEFNGTKDPAFSNPDDWNKVTLESISFSLYSVSTWGESASTYSSIFQVKEVCRFKEQIA